jgi:hypothetical protein
MGEGGRKGGRGRQDDATGEDEGVAFLEEDGKRGSKGRRRKRRRDEVTGKGGEFTEKGGSTGSKGPERLEGERNERRGGRGVGGGIARNLAMFVVKSNSKRSEREGKVRGRRRMGDGDVNEERRAGGGRQGGGPNGRDEHAEGP